MLSRAVLPALILLSLSAPAKSQTEDLPSDPYAHTRRLNLLSAALESGYFSNSFAEDRGQKPPADFTTITGRWIVGTGGEHSRHGDHHVAQTTSAATFCLLERSLLVVQNFRAEVSIAGDGGNLAKAAGLYFHRPDGLQFTFVELDWKTNQVAAYYWDGAGERLLASAAYPLWRRGWHRLGVSVQGPRLSVTLKGRLVFSAQLPYDDEAGFMGFLTRQDSRARFDQLVIRPDPSNRTRRQRQATTDP
ncbi:hypothetical protein HS125_19060 [bacterium]|nr:hypothetical protein [bacterium]